MTYIVDPPSGWQFGFPKECPNEIYEAGIDAVKDWLVEEGYPESLTKPGWFYIRTIFREE